MIEPNPNSWDNTIWALLGSSAVFAYAVRLLDRIHNRKVRSAAVEVLEFIICVCVAFSVFYLSTLANIDDRIVWILSVYLGHKGTRYIFRKLDNAAEKHLNELIGGDLNDKSADSSNS